MRRIRARIVGAMGVACVLAGAGAESGTATFSGRPGLIAYSAGGDLFAVRADAAPGGSPWRLTDSAASEEAPAWSPDGSRLAFATLFSAPDGTAWTALDVLELEGERAIRRISLWRSERGDGSPAWSPDGSRLVVGRDGALWVVRADGSHARRFAGSQRGHSPDWSPDGRRLVFARGGALLVVASAWGLPRTILGARRAQQLGGGLHGGGAAWSPSWSPDGRRLAFVAGSSGSHGIRTTQPYSMRPDGLDMRKLPAPPENFAGGPPSPPSTRESVSWSPDGRSVVYGGERVHVVDLASGTPVPLTPRLTTPAWRASWQPVCTVSARSDAGETVPARPTGDLLCGGPGADRIAGGRGSDRLFGAGGDDVLAARDGAFDIVGCGDGTDLAVVDRIDLAGVDCEHVRLRRPTAGR